jgi:hypothetical protein
METTSKVASIFRGVQMETASKAVSILRSLFFPNELRIAEREDGK